ncbi:MAG TPA: hypothetical protein VKW78_17800 [Terriglobales bacterium]|nr:hypothetical protein [Terriglobales bacterium]
MAIIPICIHIKSDGVRCGSPALRGHSRCYFHLRQFYRDKPRRQPALPPPPSPSVRHRARNLELETADDVLTPQQLYQVLQKGQRLLLQFMEESKRELAQRQRNRGK